MSDWRRMLVADTVQNLQNRGASEPIYALGGCCDSMGRYQFIFFQPRSGRHNIANRNHNHRASRYEQQDACILFILHRCGGHGRPHRLWPLLSQPCHRSFHFAFPAPICTWTSSHRPPGRGRPHLDWIVLMARVVCQHTSSLQVERSPCISSAAY